MVFKDVFDASQAWRGGDSQFHKHLFFQIGFLNQRPSKLNVLWGSNLSSSEPAEMKWITIDFWMSGICFKRVETDKQL